MSSKIELIGTNVASEVKDGKLYLCIDLSAEGKPSASGKTLVLASTKGNVSVPGHGDIKLGLNLYRYK